MGVRTFMEGAPAGRCAQDLHAAVEQRVPDLDDGGRRIAGHVDPRRPAAQRGRRTARAKHQLADLAGTGQDGAQDVGFGGEPG
jgi:hypothetical protein